MIVIQTAKAKEKRIRAIGTDQAMEIEMNEIAAIMNLQMQSQLDDLAQKDNICAQTRWLPNPERSIPLEDAFSLFEKWFATM